MTQYAIVRINDQLIPEFQINYDSKNKIAHRDFIHSWHDINLKPNQNLLLIISANLVLNSQVKIPSKNEEVIKQSIPFAVEEDLADDLSINHFAYSQIKEGEFIVSTMKKSLITKIREHLISNNLKAKGLFSEIFTCPCNDSGMSVCHQKNTSIARIGNSGTTVQNTSLNTYLKLSKIQNIQIYSESNLNIDNEKISLKDVDNISLIQAQTLIEKKNVNLFQGEYDLEAKDSNQVSPWKKVSILTLILIVSWLIIHISQLWTLRTDIDDLRKKQKDLLIQTIPNASPTELKDPYAAVVSKLKSIDGVINPLSNSFLSSFSYLGITLQQHKNIKIQSIRLRDTKFEINIRAQDVGALNKFQSSLEANAYSMRVKTGTRDTTKEGVNAILTMEIL
jgi:general secretion pathway protein L